MSEARVDMLDAATGEVVDHCYGPVLGGGCSRADRDGIVLCNGRRIAPPSAGPETLRPTMRSSSTVCGASTNPTSAPASR